jgi:hypothetical protein
MRPEVDVVVKNAKAVSVIAALAIKSVDAENADSLSWAFTPTQKTEIESVYLKAKVLPAGKKRETLVKGIGDRIIELPSVQARIIQTALETSKKDDLSYSASLKNSSREYRVNIEKNILKSFEQKSPTSNQSLGASPLFMALSKAISSRGIFFRSRHDSIQRNAAWKQQRLRYAVGKKSVARQKKWDTAG